MIAVLYVHAITPKPLIAACFWTFPSLLLYMSTPLHKSLNRSLFLDIPQPAALYVHAATQTLQPQLIFGHFPCLQLYIFTSLPQPSVSVSPFQSWSSKVCKFYTVTKTVTAQRHKWLQKSGQKNIPRGVSPRDFLFRKTSLESAAHIKYTLMCK